MEHFTYLTKFPAFLLIRNTDILKSEAVDKNNIATNDLMSDSEDQGTTDLIDMVAEQYAALTLEIYQAREQKGDFQRRKRRIVSKQPPWRSF